MVILIQWMISYLTIVCGKVFATLFPKGGEDKTKQQDKE